MTLFEFRFVDAHGRAVTVALTDEGAVRADGIAVGALASEDLRRASALVDRHTTRRVGANVGVGPRDAHVRLRDATCVLHHAAPRLDAACAEHVAVALRELFVFAARLHHAASRGALADVFAGLPDAPPDDFVLAVRRDGQPRRAYLCADGRVVHAGLGPHGHAERVLGTSRLAPGDVAESGACALRLVRAACPALGPGHDPAHGLEVVLRQDGVEHARHFIWGRSGRNDAYLEPVEDEDAQRAFARLLALIAPLDVRPDTIALEPWLGRAPAPRMTELDAETLLGDGLLDHIDALVALAAEHDD